MTADFKRCFLNCDTSSPGIQCLRSENAAFVQSFRFSQTSRSARYLFHPWRFRVYAFVNGWQSNVRVFFVASVSLNKRVALAIQK